VIAQKALLRDQLHKLLHNRKGKVSPVSAEVERSWLKLCVCTVHVHTCVSHTHQGISSFKLTLLAASVASEFVSDKTHLYVTKIT